MQYNGKVCEQMDLMMRKFCAMGLLVLCLVCGAMVLPTLPARIQTDMAALLPHDEGESALWQAADAWAQRQMNAQILVLVGADDEAQALTLAQDVAKTWRASGQFMAVDAEIAPNVDEWREMANQLGVATLPAQERTWLLNEPLRYFEARAEAIVNPFAGGVLPLEQDWLGFGGLALARQSAGSTMQWDAASGLLYTQYNGKTWVWLRARLPQQSQLGQVHLLEMVNASREHVAGQGGELLVSGGALFAQYAKQQAERESTVMSVLGLGLTLLFLTWALRSLRVLWLLLPLLVGVLLGLVATVAIFGHIHVLTLVVGTSLVGVLVDFPLHWLAPALFAGNQWEGRRTMRQMLPSFGVSLAITVLGYVLLLFAPLLVLQQTAVFSAAALVGALCATVLWLPALFHGYAPKPTGFTRLMQWMAQCRLPAQGGRWLIVLIGVMLMAGCLRIQWHDDIRDWHNAPDWLLQHSQRIAQISGNDLGGRMILLRASTPDALLALGQTVEDAVRAQQSDATVQGIHQWVNTTATQNALKNQLRVLLGQPAQYAPLVGMGIDDAVVQAALQQAASSPNISIEQSLAPSTAEAWRSLYLGQISGQYASIVRVNQMHDAQKVQAAIAHLPCDAQTCVQWYDKRNQLNQLFNHTRNVSAWLKLASFALAWLVLWRIFGMRRGSMMLGVPLLSAVMVLGILGWLGQTVGLFALFGLLLASAVGTDYAVYALTAREPVPVRCAGLTLASVTTWISFALLAFGSTPAAASFGLAVALGCVCNALLAMACVRAGSLHR